MKLRKLTIFVIMIAALTVEVASAAAPTGKIFKTEVPASKDPLIANSKYQLWIPENTPAIRTILIINMRGAGKHLFASDQEWRSLAARTQSAMMYCEFEAHGVRDNGYGLSMLKAGELFAAELKRPELKHAPFVLWGHSMGGRVAQDFVRFRPDRVLAFHIALRANPSDAEFMKEEAHALKVPGLYLMGANDGKPADIRKHFKHARNSNSPRAWVWLPGQSHWPQGMHFKTNRTSPENWRAWSANEVVIPWTEAIIRLRLPVTTGSPKGPIKLRDVRLENGWLGEIDTGAIASYAQFDGKRSIASWFPTEKIARAWVKFAFPNRQSK